MNLKAFSIIGWVFMILGVLVPLSFIITQTSQFFESGRGGLDIIREGLFPGAIIFLLVFLPGLKYYKISKSGKSNKLENWAIWLMIISILLGILLFFISALGGGLESVFLGFFILGGFLLIPYGVGVLLLVINLFVRK